MWTSLLTVVVFGLEMIFVDAYENCSDTEPASAAANKLSAANPYATEQQRILFQLLNCSTPSYNSLEAPVVKDGPLVVDSFIEILSFGSIDDVKMEFTAQFTMKQSWVDNRLRYDATGLQRLKPVNRTNINVKECISPPNCVEVKLGLDQVIWIPDTFFQTEQRGHLHLIDQPNESKMISPNGRVHYRKRLTMAFSCPMNLELYPHDRQMCQMEFSSYAYKTDKIVYRWDTKPYCVRSAAVDSLPKFDVIDIANGSCLSNTSTGSYSCLKLTMHLQRVFSYFLLQLYIPSSMLVLVSCLSFWIDWRSAPARVPLAIVTLLTITTQAQGINANLPAVSYTKAIDIWIGACVVFIFGALIEYAIVNYIGLNEQSQQKSFKTTDKDGCYRKTFPFLGDNGESQMIYLEEFDDFYPGQTQSNATEIQPMINLMDGLGKIGKTHLNGTAQLSKHTDQSNSVIRKRRGGKTIVDRFLTDSADEQTDLFDSSEYVEYRRKQRVKQEQFWSRLYAGFQNNTRAERIDFMSRILFPVGFGMFNVTYWLVYLHRNEQYDSVWNICQIIAENN